MQDWISNACTALKILINKIVKQNPPLLFEAEVDSIFI